MQSFYTSLEDAKEEIHKRWQDENLKERVRVYLGGEIPEPFQCAPRAVLSRNIISPDREFIHFLDLSNILEIEPLGFEGVEDKFVTKNEDKMCLVKMAFCGENRSVRYKRIIDIKPNDGKKFSEIHTLWGEGLVDFHHRLLRQYISRKVEVFDDLQWYVRNIGGSTKAKDYYPIYLAFFVCHGVLFENFTTFGDEANFTNEVFLPAFEHIENVFGVKPLIVPALSEEYLNDIYWWCYDVSVEKYVENNN